jgi:hypothetical protein
MTAVSDGAMIALIEASAFSDSRPRQTAARLLLGFIRNGKDIEFRDRHFEEVRSVFGADVEREVSAFLEKYDLNEATSSFGPH